MMMMIENDDNDDNDDHDVHQGLLEVSVIFSCCRQSQHMKA